MVDSQQNKGYRVISMFDRLMDGQGINKKQEAFTHNVGEKTIQRDMNEIRAYLEKAKLDCHLEYVRTENLYRLTNKGESILSKEQVLAIVKILIESRALLKSEMSDIIDKLISIVAADKQEFIHNIILNEKHLYVDLNHKKSLLHLIWVLSEAVQKKKVIKIDYLREGETIPTEKMLKPLAVIFSEYYFYLIANDNKHEKDLPIVYRVDRIQHFLELDKKFQIPYAERFQEGEFRKRIQFMHAGELMRIKFIFKGTSPQAVLDRLPTAKIVSDKDGQYLFEAEVFGHGIKMWLLSQGANIEVLEPIELREEIIETIKSMQQNYRYI
ncbi:WYL domain-containing protein [Lysinibacillus xylanilyticus]|uniref:helix-turn-helix transcriptional regulator n=1 Tax=Lysinibacillus xylanilyticus TaxID=582475 RepID=UPI002E1D27F3|nr:WYL domain-containing protein [Lysinibacillus xylanilyticus]